MKIKYRKNVIFGAAAGLACLLTVGCGASFCGFPLAAEEELIFQCAEAETYEPEEPGAADSQADASGREEPGTAGDRADSGRPEEPGVPDDSADPGQAEEPDSPENPEDGLVDLNSAGAEELMTLNGIGETRAAAIIEFREQNGPFASIEEIMMIPGIKEGIFSKIKDQIVVR